MALPTATERKHMRSRDPEARVQETTACLGTTADLGLIDKPIDVAVQIMDVLAKLGAATPPLAP